MPRTRAPRLRPTRQDTYLIHVFIGDTDIGVWDKMDGGKVDSEDTKYYPGGMADPVSLGGRRSTDNVTCSRLVRIDRDWQLIQTLINGVGREDLSVAYSPLNTDGTADPNVSSLVYNGTLKSVDPPKPDSEASGAALMTIEMIVEGFPSQG